MNPSSGLWVRIFDGGAFAARVCLESHSNSLVDASLVMGARIRVKLDVNQVN